MRCRPCEARTVAACVRCTSSSPAYAVSEGCTGPLPGTCSPHPQGAASLRWLTLPGRLVCRCTQAGSAFPHADAATGQGAVLHCASATHPLHASDSIELWQAAWSFPVGEWVSGAPHIVEQRPAASRRLPLEEGHSPAGAGELAAWGFNTMLPVPSPPHMHIRTLR